MFRRYFAYPTVFRESVITKLKTTFRRYEFNKMSTFTASFNPITGKKEWCLQDENYDYHQELARSAFADMLHDTERNQKYEKGLLKAIEKMHSQGKAAHVLDIGTGTGLLSMMAARAGAETVTACEAFEPMAKCAAQIMKYNGFGDKIKLIEKRSTDIKVGSGGDMEHRCNILVTEVFDTELIGEGAIGTFSHALRELLDEDCIVVPTLGNLYVQLASSDLMRSWNDLRPTLLDVNKSISVPKLFTSCGGAPSLHDVQLNQLPLNTFSLLTEPVRAFRFDFSRSASLLFDDNSEDTVKILQCGNIDAFFMWWDLEFDEEREIILSCAPHWSHPERREVQWRDHWMQAIYYPPASVPAVEGQEIRILSHHDEYSLWFDVQMIDIITQNGTETKDTSRPICSCGLHVTCSRTRLAMLNDPKRKKVYMQSLEKHLQPNSVCLCLGDCSMIPLMAAKLGAKHVYVIETNSGSKKIMKRLIDHNDLADRITLITKSVDQIGAEDFKHEKIDIVVAEPYFQFSSLPWHHIHFWYIIKNLSSFINRSAVILPQSVHIKAAAVEFKDLWKIRAPVRDCEGFSLKIFDDIIESSSEIADHTVETQPLWEYPCTALSKDSSVMTLDFTSAIEDNACVQVETLLKLEGTGTFNGVALWTDYQFDDSLISTGATSAVQLNKKIEWDMCTRQAVHLPKESELVGMTEPCEKKAVQILALFNSEQGEIDFKFDFL